MSHVSFQLKKCPPDDPCVYCVLNPVRMPADVFADLNFIPDPVPVSDGDKYKDFADVYGTETTDSARPGLKNKPLPTVNDKANKDLFVAGKSCS